MLQFVGDWIELVEVNDMKPPEKKEPFTYAMALARCKEVGSIQIANSTRIKKAINLGAKSCTCGWIYGETVVSVGDRSDCKDKSECTAGKHIRHVYCSTRFKP